MENDTLTPWIKVTKPFDYWPSSRSVMSYKPGTYLVKRACAEKAVREECAVVVERPENKGKKNVVR